jgi:excisionase family DNA binding protein
MQVEPERLLNKKKAASRLGVSVRSVERLLASRALERVAIRGRVLIRLSDLLRIMETGAANV